ncbi:hypothetical protein CEXT_657581 [Caerostris extrusa]|uniref:Uncharacterized protein n=1 Tax=Caerostris extrusa TaxID=172846 RepID=A0AAV4W8H3_CAEEX|nr:hypothetical protein CEXT_657581 [Caerostris extrusa]
MGKGQFKVTGSEALLRTIDARVIKTSAKVPQDYGLKHKHKIYDPRTNEKALVSSLLPLSQLLKRRLKKRLPNGKNYFDSSSNPVKPPSVNVLF